MTRKNSNKRNAGSRETGLRSANNQPVVMSTLTAQPSGFMPHVQTFPNVMRTWMRYAWSGTLTTSAGVNVVQDFRLNSLYDPDFTGAGAQPKYYDTLCGASGSLAPYGFYRVRRTLFRVTIMNTSTTSTVGAYGFAQVFNANPVGTTSTIADLFETVNCRAANVAPSGNGAFSVVSIDGSCDHAKLWAVKDWEDDEDFTGAYNGNPAAVSFLRCGVRAADDTTAITLRVMVQLVFETEMYSLNNAGLSAVRRSLIEGASAASAPVKPVESVGGSKPVVAANSATGVACKCGRTHSG